MGQYLLGIDNGGSEIKCVLFDLSGKEIGKASERVQMNLPRPGFTERDSEQLWRANVSAIHTVLKKAGIEGTDVRAVGLTGYGNGICLVDEKGAATYPCIVSTDTRAENYSVRFRANGVGRKIYPRTRQNIWSAQPAALLPWFRDNLPDVIKCSARCLGIKDFIRFKLTGIFMTELTEASSTCLCDLDTKRFSPEIFEALGIGGYERLMPPIAGSTEITGAVTEAAAKETGLTAGTPVAGGYFDIDAGAFASGVLSEDILCLIAGTWSINEHLAKKANTDADKNHNTTTLSYLPGYFMAEDSSATSASNFDWFVDQLMRQGRKDLSLNQLYRECDAVMEQLVGQDNGVVFVPYLFDSSTVSGGKAAFFNLSGYNTRAHMLQAVYEGVVFSTMLHVSNLCYDGRKYEAARLSGGVTKSCVWTQMMADALQMKIEVPRGEELSAMGAAMGAAVAAGLYKNERQAVANMVQIDKIYVPDPGKKDIYQKKYENFSKALKALAIFHA